MNHLSKLLLLIILLPFAASAQSNYQPGYAVTLKGDTLRGFIDYREWDRNPTTVNFKTAVNATKSTKLTPIDTRFFKIKNVESYMRYSGPVTLDATDPNHVAEGRDTSIKMAVIFLKVLQTGKNLNLYSYTDDIKTRFYIKEHSEEQPEELIYRTFFDASRLDYATNKGRTVNENTYLKRLFALANKYNALDDRLSRTFDNASYNTDDIVDIVSKINHISKGDAEQNASTKPKVFFFAGAGVNLVSNNTSSSSPYYSTGGRGASSTGPTASLGIVIPANPNTGKLQLRFELSAGSYKYNDRYQNLVYPYMPVMVSFSEFDISLMPEIILNVYNGENFKFYLGAGVGFVYHNFSDAYYGAQNTSDQSFSDIAKNNPFYFNSFDTPLIAKAGIQISKKWEIWGTYFSSTATTKGGFFQLSSTGEKVGLSYVF